MRTAKELKAAVERDISKILEKSGLNYPFPESLDFSRIPATQFKQRYLINYLHGYGQNSPFFAGLREHKLLGNRCENCKYVYGTPRVFCMYCGGAALWVELPLKAKVHSFTVCYESSEIFILNVPYSLVVVSFGGADTFFLSQLKNLDLKNPNVGWVDMVVEAHFSKALKNKKHVPTILDVWFEPAEKSEAHGKG